MLKSVLKPLKLFISGIAIRFFLKVVKKGSKYVIGKNQLEFNNTWFPSIDFSKMPDQPGDCLAAEYDKYLGKLFVAPSDCSSLAETVCMTKNYQEVKTCDKDRIHLSRLDILLNPEKNESKNAGVLEKKAEINNMTDRLNQTSAFDALFSTLWYASLPCYDIENVTADTNGDRGVLKYCEWKGRKISCAAIFSPYPTDQGMCCSFNMERANEMYLDGAYSQIISELQDADDRASFESSEVPKWYKDASQPTTLSGRGKGLFLILDSHMDQFTSTSQHNDYNGFMGLIHPRGDFPIMSLEGIEIKPGHINSISIAAMKVDANEDMENMDVSERKCMFDDDNASMKMHKKYSYSNCRIECSILYARDMVRTATIFSHHLGSF